MIQHLRTLRADQRGATAIEYGLILALISLVVVAAAGATGASLIGSLKGLVDILMAAGRG